MLRAKQLSLSISASGAAEALSFKLWDTNWCVVPSCFDHSGGLIWHMPSSLMNPRCSFGHSSTWAKSRDSTVWHALGCVAFAA